MNRVKDHFSWQELSINHTATNKQNQQDFFFNKLGGNNERGLNSDGLTQYFFVPVIAETQKTI